MFHHKTFGCLNNASVAAKPFLGRSHANLCSLFAKVFICLSFISAPFFTDAAAQQNVGSSFRFDFGTGPAAPGFIKITPDTRYTPERGFGFILNTPLQAQRTGKRNAAGADYITASQPFYFSVKIPEGNYNVNVLLGDYMGTSTTTIRAECRRLMVEKLETPKGKLRTAEFTVHVRDSLLTGTNEKVRLKAREKGYLHWDDQLTLEFSNTAPKICAIEITPATNVTTVFLAGNSTVVDQSEEPWAAWGQMIPAFFQPGKIAIANYAESGETLKAFERERRLQKILNLMKPGDYLFIEFAHNDQKPGGNYLEAMTTYKETLKAYIAAVRQKKGNPVLVTSMHRRSFDSAGKIINTLAQYPEAVRQTGKEENVPVLDLNAMSKTLYEAWGPEKSIKAFVHFPARTFPGQDTALKDNTHFSTYGAYQLARCVAQGIRDIQLPLAKMLRNDLPVFDPAKPAHFETWQLPAGAFIMGTRPDGN